MTVLKHTLGWLAITAGLGCYRWVPATIDTTPVGEQVQALLSTEGQIVLRERAAVDLRVVTGELLEAEGDAVLIAVRTSRSDDGFGGGPVLVQRIDIPRSHILRIDRRELDALRTSGIIAGAVGVAILLASQTFGDSNPGDAPTGDGGPDEHVTRWIVRLPIRLP